MSELGALAEPRIASRGPGAETLAGRFAQQAALTPDIMAVVTDDASVSYRDLAGMVSRIAGHLAALAGPHGPVGLLMPEGSLLYAAMLAASKANRTFVPLELSAPEAWLTNIASACGITQILTDPSNLAAAKRIAGPGTVVLDVDELRNRTVPETPAHHAPQNEAAYIIYTSGSTGRPKGVVIGNKSVLHRAWTRTERSRIKSGDRLAHLRTSGFTAGITNVIATLLSGATVLPFDVRKHGLPKLASWLIAQDITSFTITSSLLRAWLASLPDDCRFPKLRVVAVGSEPLYAADLTEIGRRLVGDWMLVHSCGATETGAFASGVFHAESRNDPGVLPIGKILPGYDVRLEKEDRSPANAGEAGEIIVASSFHALGYWNEPELTAAAFHVDGDVCTYRTGDLGRWRSDGRLEHLGRKDRKIKLRGYTVELREVECALLAIDGVKDAAVILHKDNPEHARLVAYAACGKDAAGRSEKHFRSELAKRLPHYMVPSDVVFLNALPLTGRGKVDRAALPPPPDPAQGRKSSRAASNDHERRLAEIWQNVLHIPDIGVDDDFYDLGGTSLQAMLIFSRIAATFRRDIPPVRMMQLSTVARQAKFLISDTAESSDTLVPFRAEGNLAPLFIAHGVFGDIMFGRDIARALKSDRPVYGLQPPPLDGAHRMPRNVEEIAAAYLAAIRTVQPKGPYCLAGYSFGGHVALEIARQLTRAGEAVAFLGLIDTRCSRSHDAAGERTGERIARHKQQMRGQNIPAYLGKRILKTLGYHAMKVRETAEQLPNDLCDLFHRPIPYEKRARRYRSIFLHASSVYRPRSYPGAITLFTSDETMPHHRERWRTIATGGFMVREIPANHTDMVSSAHSAMLAGFFDECLGGQAL